MDLNDYDCRIGRKYGVRFAISSDSHNVEGLWQINLGIGLARRAGLTKKDIWNFIY